MKNLWLRHIGFWLLVMVALMLYFGRTIDNYSYSFYFVVMLLPVAIGTSYFFNEVLVPRYLITKRYLKFLLYLVYTVIITLYLEMVVMVLAFVVLANYNFNEMVPLTTDPFAIAVAIYLIVLVLAFVRLFQYFQQANRDKQQMEDTLKKEKQATLVITSNRKQVPIALEDISYIESLGDYVQIVHKNEKLITKEKISALEEKLPSNFIRIHRSFIVNRSKVSSFDSETLFVNDMELPISRKYRKVVIEVLKG